MNARIQQTKTNKLILHISLNEFELDEYLLQRGKQPDGIFTIMIHQRLNWIQKKRVTK